MLILETEAKIRRLYFVQKQPIKEITRLLGLSRNTVRRVLRKGSQGGAGYRRKQQPALKLGAYQAQLEAWLLADSQLPKAQRCTAMKLYERLKACGYQGAYDSVQRTVKQWLLSSGKVGDAYVPLQFAPGEAFQFDWSEETVELGGEVQKLKVGHFRLCHSRLSFVAAYPRETQEMLFDAHAQAFEFFGGIPLRGIYDNMKTAVDTVFTGKKRGYNRRFLQMADHYLLEPNACTPGAGWEKGQVENQVGNVREWFFVPRLKFAGLAALNAHLSASCLALAQKRQHPEQKALSILEVFKQQEAPKLRPLMPAFDGYHERVSKVSSTCLVNVDRNRYSVDCGYAHQLVSVRAYATHIDVVANDRLVATHAREFKRDKTIFNPWHYVPLLERKPGALRNGAPFSEWDLPPPLQKVYEHLIKRDGGDRQCVNLLLAAQQHGLEAVTVACELALADKLISSDYILNLLCRLRPNATNGPIATPDALKLVHEPLADCQRYNRLLTETSYATH